MVIILLTPYLQAIVVSVLQTIIEEVGKAGGVSFRLVDKRDGGDGSCFLKTQRQRLSQAQSRVKTNAVLDGHHSAHAWRLCIESSLWRRPRRRTKRRARSGRPEATRQTNVLYLDPEESSLRVV